MPDGTRPVPRRRRRNARLAEWLWTASQLGQPMVGRSFMWINGVRSVASRRLSPTCRRPWPGDEATALTGRHHLAGEPHDRASVVHRHGRPLPTDDARARRLATTGPYGWCRVGPHRELASVIALPASARRWDWVPERARRARPRASYPEAERSVSGKSNCGHARRGSSSAGPAGSRCRTVAVTGSTDACVLDGTRGVGRADRVLQRA
jgi:hypothetical protein